MESTTTINERSRVSFPIANIAAWGISTLTILGTIVYYTNTITTTFLSVKKDVEVNRLQQQLDQKANELRFQQNEHRLDKLENK